jgi:hypothetical protein
MLASGATPCTTDTSCGNHFLPSIVQLCETCSGGPNFHYSSSDNGVPLWPSSPTRVIWTNASSEFGYGSILKVPHVVWKSFGSWWSLPEKLQLHSTMKELVTVSRGILRFANELLGHTVCLYEDNQTVVDIIKNHTSSSPL